jgi:uncharacterized BrkB/YihY/UPF0761 family membrane protein
MHIDWTALGIVAVVSITATLVFMILISAGIRLVSVARIKTNQGGSGTVTFSAGYALLGLAGLVVLFCLYLIVPQFH